MADISEDSSLRSPILTLPSPLSLHSKSALTRAFTQTNGQVSAIHSTATALAMAYIFGRKSSKYAKNLFISNYGRIRLLVIEVGEEFTNASIVEVGTVMPEAGTEAILCPYDDTLGNDNSNKITQVGTELEQGQRISSTVSTATTEKVEVDFEKLSTRSFVVDVLSSVGNCFLGLRDADEACLAAWMKMGNGSYCDHAKSICKSLTTEVPLLCGGFWTSLDEESKKACLREMKIFRRAGADNAFRESNSWWTGDRAGAEHVHDSKRDFSTVHADAAESLFPVTISVLCDRLLHIVRASGREHNFGHPCHQNTIHIPPHNSSKIDTEIRQQTAAEAALLVALSSYGENEDPELNIGIQILKFLEVALSQVRQADEELSVRQRTPLPESGHFINSVLVWLASPHKAIPSSSTIPVFIHEKVTDDETVDSVSEEIGEEKSLHSAGGSLMSMILRLVSIELGVSLYGGLVDEEAKVELDTTVSNCVNIMNGISDDKKEEINDDSLRTLLFDDSSTRVASVATQKLSPSTPSLPASPSLLSSSLPPPAVQLYMMPSESVSEGSKELSAHYDFGYLMTSANQTSAVVRVYECINSNFTFGLCLRCITHQGGGMVGEEGISANNFVGMHRRHSNAPFHHSEVRHSNIVRMDRARSGCSSGEHFRVVLQGLPSHQTEKLGTSFNAGIVVMVSTVFEEMCVEGGNSLNESMGEKEEEKEQQRKRKMEFTKAVYMGPNVGSMSITFPLANDTPNVSFYEWAVLIVEERECDKELSTDPASPDQMDRNYAMLGAISLNDCKSDVCMVSLVREREGGLYSVQADYLYPLVIPPMEKTRLPHSVSRLDSGAFRRLWNSLENGGEEFDRQGEHCKSSSRIASIPFESCGQNDPPDVGDKTKKPCCPAVIFAFLCMKIAVKAMLYCTILFLATKVPYIFIIPERMHSGLWQAYLKQKSVAGVLSSLSLTSDVTAVSSDVPSYLSGKKMFSEPLADTWMKTEKDLIEIAEETKRMGVRMDVADETFMELAPVAADNGKDAASSISSVTPAPTSTFRGSVNLIGKTVSQRVISLAHSFLDPMHFMLSEMLKGFSNILFVGWKSTTRGTERRTKST